VSGSKLRARESSQRLRWAKKRWRSCSISSTATVTPDDDEGDDALEEWLESVVAGHVGRARTVLLAA
jgi:hypothetical protein